MTTINCQELRPEARCSSFVKQPLAGTGILASCRQQLFASPKTPAWPLTADRVVSLPCSPLGLPPRGRRGGRSPAVPLLTDGTGCTWVRLPAKASAQPLPPAAAELRCDSAVRCAPARWGGVRPGCGEGRAASPARSAGAGQSAAERLHQPLPRWEPPRVPGSRRHPFARAAHRARSPGEAKRPEPAAPWRQRRGRCLGANP